MSLKPKPATAKPTAAAFAETVAKLEATATVTANAVKVTPGHGVAGRHATRQLLDTVKVGAVPVGILMTPDGQRAFVANTNANQVSVIDVAERKVLRTFSTGNEPDGMAWAK